MFSLNVNLPREFPFLSLDSTRILSNNHDTGDEQPYIHNAVSALRVELSRIVNHMPVVASNVDLLGGSVQGQPCDFPRLRRYFIDARRILVSLYLQDPFTCLSQYLTYILSDPAPSGDGQ